MNKDLTIAGDGSPISIKKFLETDPFKNSEPGIKVLLDQTGSGFDKEDLPHMEINPEECARNADWYREKSFDGTNIPQYIMKYMAFFYEQKIYEVADDYKKLQDHLKTPKGKEEIQFLRNVIKYGKNNLEGKQIIGLITLWVGMLKECKHWGIPLKLILQHPETHLHPGKTAKLMMFFETTIKEFYPELKNHVPDDDIE